MCNYKQALIFLFSLGLLGTGCAQGLGGTVLPTNSDQYVSEMDQDTSHHNKKNTTVQPIKFHQFRSEIDVGFIYPEFSRFKFGDVRNVFPDLGGEIIKDAFNERHYAPSYYVGAREAIKLSNDFLGGVPELNLSFGLYNAKRHSRFIEDEITPEVYVPYIDGNIRPDLSGGSVVGLFADSDLRLTRKLFSYDLEAGFRTSYKVNKWFVMPGIFFNYKRMQQEDHLITSNTIDPAQMTLSSHVNSNHYDVGGNFRFTSPLTANISWLGCVAIAAEYADAHYSGRQTFTGDVFDEANEQLATVKDSRHKWGFTFGAETGFGIFCSHRISFSILGNMKYINVMPYVNYPVPIINTEDVNGPAHLGFQKQLTFGAEANLSFVF
jgi:hypothetical protein